MCRITSIGSLLLKTNEQRSKTERMNIDAVLEFCCTHKKLWTLFAAY